MSKNKKYLSIDKDSYAFVSESYNLPTIPPGFYNVLRSPSHGFYLNLRAPTVADDYVPLPNPASAATLEIVKNFLDGTYEKAMRSMGLVHKLACVLWGAPGTSKSVTIYEITKYAIERGAIVINGTSASLVTMMMNSIREIEPDRPVVVIWEEADDTIENDEEDFLQMLDGGSQADNIIHLMTTNYINRIPERLFLRFRRVPFQVEFKLPDRTCREAYFRAKIPTADAATMDLTTWLDASDGFSLDQCAQLILAVYAFRKTIEDVIADLEIRKAVY